MNGYIRVDSKDSYRCYPSSWICSGKTEKNKAKDKTKQQDAQQLQSWETVSPDLMFNALNRYGIICCTILQFWV